MGIATAVRDFTFGLGTSLLDRWLAPTILDADAVAACTDPVVYALPQRSLLDLMVLELAARRSGLHLPTASIEDVEPAETRSLFFLSRPEGWLLRRPSMRRRSQRMQRLIDVADGGTAISVVPVSVFWGRAPDRERSLLRLLFSERWTVTGSARKLFALLFNASNVFVQFGAPIALTEVCAHPGDGAIKARRLARLLRTRFRGQRTAMIGPDLSHRRTLVQGVLRSASVTAAVDDLVEAGTLSRARAERRAAKYANEIASDLSFGAIRFFDVLLTWLWHRLYDGIEVQGTDDLKAAAASHTLIYVPCHRSHMDYLLLSYVLFYNGLSLPHVAAGENLNLPVAGALLRRAGAFFMRRRFRDDPLYSAVFAEYLNSVFEHRSSVEYFIEGGRSRTGRMLPPREGMLAMTVRSALRNPQLPLAFVPVYFGYEKIVEVRSYMGELRGQAKQKESLFGLLRSLKNLRQSFGRVRVNFAPPLPLQTYLDEHQPDWREQAEDRPPWLPELVDGLADDLTRRINGAVSVTPVALMASALLDMPRQALDETSLAANIDSLLTVARRWPPSAAATITDMDGAAVITYCEQLGLLEREPHPLGDILAISGINTITLTWYRNNVQHVFALPSLIAALLGHGRVHASAALVRMARTVHPYLSRELYLPYGIDDVDRQVEGLLDLFEELGYIERDADGWRIAPVDTAGAARLQRMGRLIMPTLERYYIVVALLENHPGGRFTRGELERACVLTAQRMARVHGLNAPEFFDPGLFHRFIDTLLQQGMVRQQGDHLHYAAELPRIAVEATRIIGADFRQDVLQTRLVAEAEARVDV